MLAITGVEALYADMGHFGREAITRAWFMVVFPGLCLNYMGQGATILHFHGAVENPFFYLLPAWSRMPMVLLATVATVIASQSVISGAFSLGRQALQLGYPPRLRIDHTSVAEIGRVHVPVINWSLFICVVMLVLGFRTSAHLATAYGVSVTGTITITSILFLVVARRRLKLNLVKLVLAGSVFVVVDLSFFSAQLPKLISGGWFPLTVALAAFTVFSTWSRGRQLVTRRRIEAEGDLHEFIEMVHATDPPVRRVPGTAVFLHANPETTPLGLRANLNHNHALHETIIIMSVQTLPVPFVAERDRVTIDDLGYTDDGIFRVSTKFGFKETVDVPAALAVAASHGGLECPVDVEGASYFMSKVQLRRGNGNGMAPWRKRLFLNLARHAGNPAEYFGVPYERAVVMGGHIGI